MRLSTLFAVYLVSTVAAIATPFAIHGAEMAYRRMILVNSEAPLELAPKWAHRLCDIKTRNVQIHPYLETYPIGLCHRPKSP